MAFTTPEKVTAMTGSALDAPTLEGLIIDSDEEIVSFVTDIHLLTIPSPPPNAIKLASMYLTASKVILLQKHDGTQPNVLRAGNLYENVTVDKTADLYEAKAWKLLRGYVYGQTPDVGVMIKTD